MLEVPHCYNSVRLLISPVVALSDSSPLTEVLIPLHSRVISA